MNPNKQNGAAPKEPRSFADRTDQVNPGQRVSIRDAKNIQKAVFDRVSCALTMRECRDPFSEKSRPFKLRSGDTELPLNGKAELVCTSSLQFV
jgi:hypothetical protein